MDIPFFIRTFAAEKLIINSNTTMAKKNKFAKGDVVSGKRFNGDHFIGVYVHEYDCGDHLVTNGEIEFCVYAKDCHHANDEEKEQIQPIVKLLKEKEKNKHKKPTVENDEEELVVEVNEEELEEPINEEE